MIQDTGSDTGARPSATFFRFPLLIIFLPLLRIHLSPPPGVFDSPDHAAHYHILGLQVGGFISDSALD
jgi:hypothetical protein